MKDNNKEPDIGWKSLQPSSAHVTHYLNAEGKALCSPNFIDIVLTNAQIEQFPKAFPEQRVKKLRKLPVCTRCVARADTTRARSYMTVERDKLLDQMRELRAENETLKDELAKVHLQLAKASALIGQ